MKINKKVSNIFAKAINFLEEVKGKMGEGLKKQNKDLKKNSDSLTAESEAIKEKKVIADETLNDTEINSEIKNNVDEEIHEIREDAAESGTTEINKVGKEKKESANEDSDQWEIDSKKEKKKKKDYPKKCYTNRELTWLKFNERVLNEAGNPKVPLAERLSFISIFQTNLDEFFRVRVGTLTVQRKSKKKIFDNKTGMSPKKQIKKILAEVQRLEKKKDEVYEQLMGELEPHGVRVINFNRLSDAEGKFLEQYFDSHVAPFLIPMILDKQQPFPFLENEQLYAVVIMSTPKSKRKVGIVPCSNSVFERLIEIPTREGNFMLSEDLILHFCNKIFPYYTVEEKAIFRITRNADIDSIDISDEGLDFRGIMEKLLKKRTRLNPVRVELSKRINESVSEELAGYLHVNTEQFLFVETPLDLSFVHDIQDYLRGKSELFYNPRKPQASSMLDIKQPLIPQVLNHDVLLEYPFESIRPFLELLHEAANDDSVYSIKMTLYRLASQSKVIDYLIEAAENGKEVVVLLELRARFDEANNIENSRRLEEAGCRIIYGLDNYKVHSKLCLISRKIRGEKRTNIQYITQIGTGNYNEKTAALYTDLALITAHQGVGREAAKVFDSLLMGELMQKTEHMLVAPKCLQNKLIDMMDEQIENVRNGKEGYIGVKINSLTDLVIINKLIDCSMAGVHIDLIIRGICCLIPGIEGYTDNIRVISIVGRYLEHDRIYIFGKGEERKMFISSADFMTRNTIRRVEIAAPIYDKVIQEKILHIFEVALSDDEKGKELLNDGLYHDRSVNKTPVNSQEVLFQEAYDAAKTV